MRKIPPKMRERMAEDPYMKQCCLWDMGGCGGRVEWHHEIIHAGRQLNEIWAILPVCHEHHDRADVPPFSRLLRREALNRANDEELQAISKAEDYIASRDRLNEEFGI